MTKASYSKPQSILELFRSVARSSDGERITIGDLMKGMDERALAALILLFSLPNALPALPGTSTVLGIPLLILSTQFTLGLPIWLPRFITRRSVNRNDFEKMLAKAEPWLAKAERLLKPRLFLLSSYPAERALGILWLILALVLVFPIPLGNMPPAIALCIMSLGLLAADGLFILVGVAVAIGSLVLASSVVYGLLVGALLFFQKLFAG